MIKNNFIFARKELFRLAHGTNGSSNFVKAIPPERRRKVVDANMHLMADMEFENGYPQIKAFTGDTDFQLIPYTDSRTRFIGAYWQLCGFNVIPTASWGGLDSFSYCFNGLPYESVVAVSAMGSRRNEFAFKRWCYGLRRLENDRRPIRILVYGDPIEVPDISTPIQFLPNYISTHFRNGNNKK